MTLEGGKMKLFSLQNWFLTLRVCSFAKEHNPRFAECAELAARSAFSLVICGTLERMRMALEESCFVFVWFVLVRW